MKLSADDASVITRSRYLRISVITGCCALLIWNMFWSLDVDRRWLDVSWVMSLPVLLEQNEIIGRDAYFPYGPVYQYLGKLALELHSTDSAYSALELLLMVPIVLSTLIFGLNLFLIRELNWIFALLVFILSIMARLVPGYDLLRFHFSICVMLLLARIMTVRNRRRRFAGGLCIGGLGVLAQLMTFEQGLYVVLGATGFLAFYVVLALVSAAKKLRPTGLLPASEYAKVAGAVLGAFVALNVLISLGFWVTSPNYTHLFYYQLRMLDMSRGYFLTLGVAWAFGSPASIVLLLTVAYVTVSTFQHLPTLDVGTGYCLVSLLAYSFVASKAAIVRSDPTHILYGSSSFLLSFLVIGNDWYGRRRVKLVWAALLFLLVGFWPAFRQLKVSLPAISVQQRLADITRNQAKSPPIAEKIAGMENPDTILMVFPYENYIGIASDRQLLAPIVQSYSATTIGLQEYYVRNLVRRGVRVGVLLGLNSMWVDDVQNITRTPVIFEHLYRQYELDPATSSSEFALLRMRREPRDMVRVPLVFDTQVTDNGQLVNLRIPAQCGLIQLEVTFRYPGYSFLGRPEAIHLTAFQDSAAVAKTDIVALSVADPFVVYVLLTDPYDLAALFHPTDSLPPVDWNKLVVSVEDTGLFGVAPSEFHINGVSCVEAVPLL